MKRTAALLVALCLSFVALAGDFEEGVAAYEKGDYATALSKWRPLADQGHARAQYSLGFMYREGLGVPLDYKKAVRFYRLAADQGIAVAQFNLGVMYDEGQGVPQDYKEAVRLYRLAADQGNAGAQSNLGTMYLNGRGVPEDELTAYMWFNIAAAAGDTNAMAARMTMTELMTSSQIEEGQKLTRACVAKNYKGC